MVCCLLFVFCCLYLVVGSLLFVVSCLFFVACSMLCVVCSLLSIACCCGLFIVALQNKIEVCFSLVWGLKSPSKKRRTKSIS